MLFRLLALSLAALALASCVRFTPEYLRATEYERAVMLYESGFIADARDKAGAIPKDDPSHGAAKKLLIEIEALAAVQAKEHMQLGLNYERAGVISSAVDEYDNALRLKPDLDAAQKRIEALRAGKRPSLPERAKKKEREDPEALASAHYAQGKAYLEGKKYYEAIEELGAALRIMPDHQGASDLLARAVGERDKAADVHFKRGMRYFQEEEMELAVKEWDRVLELNPDNEKAAEYRARAEAIIERVRAIKERQGAVSPK